MTHRARLQCLACFGVLTLGLFTVACDDESTTDSDGGNDVIDSDGTTTTTNGDATDMDVAPETCSETEPCSDAADVCDPATSTCVAACTDTSCDVGLVCDMETGLCVAGNACTTNDECTVDGEVCNGCRGVCEPSDGAQVCETDANCRTTEFCEPCRGVCAERAALCEPCLFDRECGSEADRCVDVISAGGRFCLQGCSTTNDCDEGYRCEDVGGGDRQCVPASGSCENPVQCTPETEIDDCRGVNEICRRGVCSPGCTEGGCPSMQVCDEGRCLPSCEMRPEGCPAPTMCNTTTGLCEVDGMCRASRDCEDESYCDLTTQLCTPGCQVDTDCGTFDKACVDGTCERRGCTGAYACGFEEVCDLAIGECAAAEGPHCDTCDPDMEGACGPEANKCLSLQDEDGNDKGSFCFVACSDDPDNECPQGYQCSELMDQDGNPAGRVCFRDCTDDPFQ